MRIIVKESCRDCPNFKESIFADLDQVTLSFVDQRKVINQYQKGQALFLQDNPSFGAFCIKSGKIKNVKSDNNGNESIVRLVNPGEIIGHASLLAEQPYYVSGVALENCNACFFDKKTILELIAGSPAVALNIIKSLCTSLKSSELHSASKTQQNVREKLACLFLDLMKTNGIQEGDSCKLDIRLTREELASIIGSTTETVCRFITEFKNEGLIREQDKTIYVINEKKLKTFANI